MSVGVCVYAGACECVHLCVSILPHSGHQRPEDKVVCTISNVYRIHNFFIKCNTPGLAVVNFFLDALVATAQL